MILRLLSNGGKNMLVHAMPTLVISSDKREENTKKGKRRKEGKSYLKLNLALLLFILVLFLYRFWSIIGDKDDKSPHSVD